MDFLDFTKKLDREYRKDCVEFQSAKPWFGHFTIETYDNRLSYKIGDAGKPGMRILDWRHPLAKGYFSLEPGDAFDMDEYQKNLPRTSRYVSISGDILQRTSITERNRTIHKATIRTEDGDYVVEADGDGYSMLDDVTARFSSIDGLPDIRSLLTSAQYKLITSSTRKPVIIQGQAGSGKTTVALYRTSWLMYPEGDHTPIDPKNVLIVMFNRALQGFVSTSLGPLGLTEATVSTFHAWALKEVKQAYSGAIDISVETFQGSSTARSLKKQIGLLNALDEFVAGQTDRLYRWVEEKLQPYGDRTWLQQLKNDGQPIVQRLISLRKKALTDRNNAGGTAREKLKQIHILLSKAVTRMTLYKEELLNFLTSTALLKKHLPNVPESDLEQMGRYQRALQSKNGSSRRPGPFIAFEDLALILRLIQLKNGGLADKENDDFVNLYDHLVIDEAQDFGAVEMTVLLSAVRARSGVTIVGDTNQKIVPEADFMGWDRLAEQLGIEGAEVAKLEVAHRSTREIMDLACSIIDIPSSGGRPGPRPALTIVDSEDAKLACIVSIINELLIEAPSSHICLVCRHAKDAGPLKEKLQRRDITVPVRLGHNRQFEFSPGVTVTNLRQIKGLEFDSVILLDPTEANYPAGSQGQKHLYTVITRAKDHLYIVGNETPCALLDPAIEAGIVDLKNALEVVPIEFTDDDEDPF